MQLITNADIIRANRNAIKTGTLGALAGEDQCHYDYDGNGHRCAIGVCLNDESFAKLRDPHWNARSVLEIHDQTDFVKFADIEAAQITQTIHDYWAQGYWLDLESVDFKNEIYRQFVQENHGEHAGLKMFEAWLDVLEKQS